MNNDPNGLDDGIDAPIWHISLCLLLSWIVLFFVLVKGVQGSGKVAYFTALFPYLVLFILLIRGATLPGAVDGIYFFINPEWHRLLEPKVSSYRNNAYIVKNSTIKMNLTEIVYQ